MPQGDSSRCSMALKAGLPFVICSNRVDISLLGATGWVCKSRSHSCRTWGQQRTVAGTRLLVCGPCDPTAILLLCTQAEHDYSTNLRHWLFDSVLIQSIVWVSRLQKGGVDNSELTLSPFISHSHAYSMLPCVCTCSLIQTTLSKLPVTLNSPLDIPHHVSATPFHYSLYPCRTQPCEEDPTTIM